MKIESPTREESAKKVLHEMLNFEELTKVEISRLSNMEDSGRIIDFIRWKLFVPVECNKKPSPTVWYITEAEIYDYHRHRYTQIEHQKLKYLDKRLDKIINWAIDIASTDQGKELVEKAINKINRSIKNKKRPAQ
jgi:hypothetical protein